MPPFEDFRLCSGIPPVDSGKRKLTKRTLMALSFARTHPLLVSLFALASSSAAQTVRLNGPLAQPRVGDVQGFAISPDGARVVFRADVQKLGQ